MNEFTPTTEQVRSAYQESRGAICAIRGMTSEDEFYRWLDAHDQSIRDAVRPAELTAKEHLEAAWDKAHPVSGDVPPGVTIIARRANGDFWVDARGWTSGINDIVEVRTLEPLPPVIPDDCNAVWASTRGDESRRVWVRAIGFAACPDEWDDGDSDYDYVPGTDLIDPKPVPEEER